VALTNVSAIPLTYAWRPQQPGAAAAEFSVTPSHAVLRPGQQQELVIEWKPVSVARCRQAFVMDIQVGRLEGRAGGGRGGGGGWGVRDGRWRYELG